MGDKTKTNTRATVVINKTRVRAYAKTIENGIRTIDEIPEEYRVPVYIELINSHNWNIEMVDERYVELVNNELEALTK